jgi:hypothetical protein
MSAVPVTIDAIISAFALPPGPQPRRVPKASLADNAPTVGDRRVIDAKLARLDWVAAISPTTAGIAGATMGGMNVATINLLAARTRGPMPPRIAEIIHRAIPQPVILIHATEEPEEPAAISLAPKRADERVAGRVIVTALHDSGPLRPTDNDFLLSMNLSRLPSQHLADIYCGLIDRLVALSASRISSRTFRLAASPEERTRWREALASIADLNGRISIQSGVMRRESRLSARVELGETVRQLKLALDNCIAMLN